MSTTLESLEPQALVDVVLDSSTEPLVTSVKDVTGLRVVLEAPVDRKGRLVLPSTGMGGLIVWRGDRELVQAPLAVLTTSRPPGPQWAIKVTGTPSPCQRRSFVRADVDLPAVLRALHGPRYDRLVTLELSRDAHRAHGMVPRAMSPLRAAEPS